MHYKNGRPARNGDKVLFKPQYGGIPVIGILYDAIPGIDDYTGKLARLSSNDLMPNLRECLHIDDVDAAVFPTEAPPHDAK